MHIFLLFISFIVFSCTNVIAQTYSQALLNKAKAGNAVAQYQLAECYNDYSGSKGVEHDSDKAFYWYEKAAQKGNVDAMYKIGSWKGYEKWMKTAAEKGHIQAQTKYGLQLKKEKKYEEAFRWFKKAAEKGDEEGLSELSLCYCQGQGVEKDYAKSIVYIKRAAEMNYAYAQYHLAKHYEEGKGVSKDSLLAYEWFKKAADSNHYDMAEYKVAAYNFWGKGGHAKDYPLAAKYFEKSRSEYGKYILGWMYEKGKGVEVDLPKAFENYYNGANASKNALTGLTNWANKENADAQYWLAKYYTGKAYKQNSDIENDSANYWYKQALPLLEKAANQGQIDAINHLGYMYDNGLEGVEENNERAVEWYKKGVEKGNSDSMERLANIYYYEDDVECDYKELVQLCEKSIAITEKESKDKGYDYFISNDCYTILGDCYVSGTGVQKNEQKAFELYSKDNLMTGLSRQGDCYRFGIGVQKNKEKAFRCYYDAADGGSWYNRYDLAVIYEEGELVKKDVKKAFKIYKDLADVVMESNTLQDWADPVISLAKCYVEGIGTKQNVQEGINLYKKCIEVDDPMAEYCLARLYYDGKYVLRSKEREKELFELLEKCDNHKKVPVAALKLLSACYRYGVGTEVDLEKEQETLERAATVDEGAQNILKNTRKPLHD